MRAVTIAQAVLSGLALGRLSTGRRRRPRLAAGEPDVPGTISAVVPARDEAGRLGPCLDGLLADPDLLEVLVVDDGSADATPALAAAAGARVLAGRPPPPGWAGKPWALQQGIEAARGDWVLHVDADVRPRPGLARALVAAAAEHGDDLVSAAPRCRTTTWGERVLHPALTATVPYRLGPLDVAGRRPPARRALIVGQCVLLPRARFLAAGGYARVADRLVEDVALARSLARDGWAIGVVDPGALAEVAGYGSAAATLRGWGRSIALADATAPAQLAVEVATLWLVLALPVLRAATGRATPLDRLLLAVRAGLAAAVGRGYRPRSALALLAPLADPLAAAVVTRGALRPSRTWRGRTYA